MERKFATSVAVLLSHTQIQKFKEYILYTALTYRWK